MGKPFRVIDGGFDALDRPFRTKPRPRLRGRRRPPARAWPDITNWTILTAAALTFAAIVWGPEAYERGEFDRLLSVPWTSQPVGAGERVAFSKCHTGGGYNCVVDGDTIWLKGENIRLLDIDTPETHPPRCAEEARLGNAATDRLHALLNAGAVSLTRDGTDRYGRTLAVVMMEGRPVGDTLIAEGLARAYGHGRQSWC